MDPVSKAQLATEQPAKTGRERSLLNLRGPRWVKGQSGNPGGRPKKSHITTIYEKVLAKRGNRDDIEQAVMEELTRKGMAKVLLLREMAERTEGKIAEQIDINANLQIMSDEELQQKLLKIVDVA